MERDVVFTILFLFLEIRTSQVKVKVNEGVIYGNREMTIFDGKIYYAFYGVPYAQAPIGKLRFKDPKAIKKWSKSFDARTEYHGACAQPHIVHKNRQYGFENCLHLNIYTPLLPSNGKQSLSKAVIVWIHGYAFTSSLSHIHGPDFLIDNDVVLVTLAHRIGAFGFLKLNSTDYHANMGLKDIVMGLKWIKKNINKFGGDKNRVTVMGSGSGSTFLSLLAVTKYKKLFSKMILQSGSIFSPSLFHGNYLTEKNKLEEAIKKAGFKDFKSVPSENIIEAYQKIYNSKDVINSQRPIIPFMPVTEKESKRALLTMSEDTIFDAVKKTDFAMPILIGFTSQESITEIIPFIHNRFYLKSLDNFFKYMVPFPVGCSYKYSTNIYKTISNKIKRHYFENGISENSLNDFLKFVSDLRKYPIYKFIKSRMKYNNELFVYKFNYIGKLNVAKATSMAGSDTKLNGSAQGDEICYVLKCDPHWETYVKLKNNRFDRDRIFIKQISQMWANFAKTGNPSLNSYGNITWLPMSLKGDNVMLFGKESRLVNSKPEQKMYTFWKQIYNNYYAPDKCKDFKDEL